MLSNSTDNHLSPSVLGLSVTSSPQTLQDPITSTLDTNSLSRSSLPTASTSNNLMVYYFTYYYSNGDYYKGLTLDTSDKYTQGYSYNPAAVSTETGSDGMYYIDRAVSGYAYNEYSYYIGWVETYSYYDSESNTFETPYYYTEGDRASGYKGLGSEIDYINGDYNDINGWFGWDYYEADKYSLAQRYLSSNIQDGSLRSLSISKSADGTIDRDDAIAILKDAKDGNTIDATELSDLRTLVNYAYYLQIPEYVAVLTNKVVNGDTANQKSGIGNLYAGSSDTQMEKLINKWFYGSDRPTTPYTYQYASGALFQTDISYKDVKQGDIGDCYFLAGLAATALKLPSTIESMFINNGDDTFTVRFYNNGVADYVTVDRYLPTSANKFAYASKGSTYNSSTNELWVALAEKAYAQLNESGWTYRWNGDRSNSYQGINAGYVMDSLAQITGRVGYLDDVLDYNSLVKIFNSGGLVTLATKSSGVAANIYPSHSYVILGFDSSTQKFTLFNPWGVDGTYDRGNYKPGIFDLSWSEILTSFSYWEYAIV